MSENKHTADISSQGGRAIAWHLRQGLDNGDIGREPLARWIVSICDQHDSLKARNAELLKALRRFIECTSQHDDCCRCGFCDAWEEAKTALANEKEPA